MSLRWWKNKTSSKKEKRVSIQESTEQQLQDSVELIEKLKEQLHAKELEIDKLNEKIKYFEEHWEPKQRTLGKRTKSEKSIPSKFAEQIKGLFTGGNTADSIQKNESKDPQDAPSSADSFPSSPEESSSSSYSQAKKKPRKKSTGLPRETLARLEEEKVRSTQRVNNILNELEATEPTENANEMGEWWSDLKSDLDNGGTAKGEEINAKPEEAPPIEPTPNVDSVPGSPMNKSVEDEMEEEKHKSTNNVTSLLEKMKEKRKSKPPTPTGKKSARQSLTNLFQSGQTENTETTEDTEMKDHPAEDPMEQEPKEENSDWWASLKGELEEDNK